VLLIASPGAAQELPDEAQGEPAPAGQPPADQGETDAVAPQPFASREPPAEARVSLRLPLMVYAGSAAADLFTTHAALQRPGFYEKNPVGAWLDERPTTLVVVSATADAALVWGLHRWLAPRHSRLLRAGLYVASGVRFWLAARNAAAVRAHDRDVRRVTF
jgi:hypothetical protein